MNVHLRTDNYRTDQLRLQRPALTNTVKVSPEYLGEKRQANEKEER
jgi:hypothetical protein